MTPGASKSSHAGSIWTRSAIRGVAGARSTRGALALLVGLALVGLVPAQHFADFGYAKLGQEIVMGGSVAAHDVNGDGHPDVLTGTQVRNATTAKLALYYGRGDGTFVRARAAQFPDPKLHASYHTILFEDVDGDGDADVFAAGSQPFAARSMLLWLNDGSGKFREVSATHLPPAKDERPGALVFVDVDADGDRDLLLASLALVQEGPILWKNDGRGRFTASPTPMLLSKALVAQFHVTDVDGDGDEDLFYFDSPARLFLQGPPGTWTLASSSKLPRTILAPAFAIDFDNDGDADVMTTGYRGNMPYPPEVWRNDGKGKFQLDNSVSLPPRIDRSLFHKVVDIDADGWPDVVVPGSIVSKTWWWRNDRGRRFVDESQRFAIPVTYAASSIVDVDHDGDLDVVGGHQLAPTKLFTNLSRQLQIQAEATLAAPALLSAFAQPGSLSAAVAVQPWIAPRRLNKNLELPGLGSLAIDLSGAFPLAPMWLSPPWGNTAITLRVPNNVALRGKDIFVQGLFYPPLRLSSPSRISIR